MSRRSRRVLILTIIHAQHNASTSLQWLNGGRVDNLRADQNTPGDLQNRGADSKQGSESTAFRLAPRAFAFKGMAAGTKVLQQQGAAVRFFSDRDPIVSAPFLK